MARDRIDWDLWLDKPYAKLWITQIVFFILSIIFFAATFSLLFIKVIYGYNSIAFILPTIVVSIIALLFYFVSTSLALIREFKVISYRRNQN